MQFSEFSEVFEALPAISAAAAAAAFDAAGREELPISCRHCWPSVASQAFPPTSCRTCFKSNNVGEPSPRPVETLTVGHRWKHPRGDTVPEAIATPSTKPSGEMGPKKGGEFFFVYLIVSNQPSKWQLLFENDSVGWVSQLVGMMMESRSSWSSR